MLLKHHLPWGWAATGTSTRREAPFTHVPARRPNWILVGVGALLILLSARGPLLILGGLAVDARITAVTESTFGGEYPQPSLVVNYAFTASDGSTQLGSFTVPSAYIENRPQIGAPVRVRYLSAWPALHTADGTSELTLIAAASAVAGALLIFFGIKRSTAP